MYYIKNANMCSLSNILKNTCINESQAFTHIHNSFDPSTKQTPIHPSNYSTTQWATHSTNTPNHRLMRYHKQITKPHNKSTTNQNSNPASQSSNNQTNTPSNPTNQHNKLTNFHICCQVSKPTTILFGPHSGTSTMFVSHFATHTCHTVSKPSI